MLVDLRREMLAQAFAQLGVFRELRDHADLPFHSVVYALSEGAPSKRPQV